MNRRGFLIASAAPLVSVPAAALAGLNGVAEPFPGVHVCIAPDVKQPQSQAARADLVGRYVTFLAHEHRLALIELLPAAQREARRGSVDVPMWWFPEAPEVIHYLTERPPSDRAQLVLQAAGL